MRKEYKKSSDGLRMLQLSPCKKCGIPIWITKGKQPSTCFVCIQKAKIKKGGFQIFR